MDFNKRAVNVYLDNINAEGKRIYTWITLAKTKGVDKITLAKISSIRKRTTDDEFNLFLECMRNGETVLLSNGTSSYNIQHISTLLRENNTIVGKGKAASTTCERKRRSSLYLLYSAGYYKIGVTLDSSIHNRIKQLQTGNPNIITLVSKTGTTTNAYELEKTLHKNYKKNRVRGEWFTLNKTELKDVLSTIESASC
jgi:hypothetical protein